MLARTQVVFGQEEALGRLWLDGFLETRDPRSDQGQDQAGLPKGSTVNRSFAGRESPDSAPR